MPSNLAPPQSPTGPTTNPSLVSQRLRETRRKVKVVDLCTRLARLFTFVLAYLFGLALVDHWIVGLTETMRLVALLALVLGCGVFFVRAVLPLFLQEVNPLFAAHTIEQAEPSLKNSLVNLVLISRRREGVRPIIFDGMRRQAAGQIENVDPEMLVDRGPLIHAGYWLVGLLAIAAGYKLLSPKDPLQTAARVAAPWKAIDRPARVSISNVIPGDTQLYRGESLDVEATIRGLGDEEVAVLVYTTDDRQFVDQPLTLERTRPSQFRGVLQTGQRGLQQSLTYHIVAGDAETSSFRVVVKDAPHIEVSEIEYQFPSYTGLKPRKQVGTADLIAIEGTRVVIHGQANQPIAEAAIELFNRADDAGSDAVADQSLPMKHQGERSYGRMTLLLRADRRSPRADAYQLRFTTKDGHRNVQPTRHAIEVIPDLAPDVEILAPLSRDTELPEDRTLVVEVRALDPDFEVQQIRLLAVNAGKELFDIPTLEQPAAGQVVRKVKLIPRQHQLVAGDEILIWAVAQDNRHDVSGKLASNTRRTENYRIRIVPPSAKDSPGQAADGASKPEGTAGQSDSAEDATSNDSGGSGDASSDETGDRGSGESGTSEESGGGEGDTAPEGTVGDKGPQGSGGSDQEPQNRTESSTPSEAGDGLNSEAREGGETESNSSGDAADDSSAAEDASDAGSESREPVASDGSNDSEAFERILRRQREDQQDGEPDAGRVDDRSSRDEIDAEHRDPGGSSDAGSRDETERAQGTDQADRQPAVEQDTDDTGQDTDGDTGQDTDGGGGQDTDGGGEAANEATRESPTQDTDDDPKNAGNNGDGSGEQVERRQAVDGGASQEEVSQDTDANPSDANRQDTDADPVQSADELEQAADDQSEPRRRDERSGREQPTSEGEESSSEGDSSEAEPNGDAGRQRREGSGGEAGPTGPESAQDRTGSGARDGDDGSSSDQTDQDAPAEAGSGDRSTTTDANRGTQDPSTSPGQRQSDSTSNGDRALNAPQSASGDQSRQGEPSNRDDSAKNDPRQESEGQGGSSPEAGATRRGEQSETDSVQKSSNTGGAQDSSGRLDTDNSAGNTPSEDPNLDYSRQATDLALEYLQDHQNDTELLDELGWTREEMDAFVRRWQDMRAKARGASREAESAQRELDDQLRGLGLQPPDGRVQRHQIQKDSLRRLRQASGNQTVPAEYRDQYRAFLRSVPDASSE